MELEELIIRLYQVVALGYRHKHYKHVVKKAQKYRTLTTGVGLDEMLEQFVRREDPELFLQRKKFTKHVVTSVVKNIMDVFYKVPRSNNARRVLTYSGDNNNSSKLEDLNNALDHFWGDKSWDEYMSTRFIELQSTDPNAFVAFEFKSTDGQTLVQPYPFEIYSDEAVDYVFKNNVLQYLIVMGSYEVLSLDYNPDKKPIPEDSDYFTGKQYTLYTKDRTIQLLEMQKGFEAQIPIASQGIRVEYNGKKYVNLAKVWYEQIEYAPHGLGVVPAFRAGYVRDLSTRGATMLSVYDAAIPYLEKTIKTNSEMDLTQALLAFPQQVRYGVKCDADGCFNGTDTRMNEPCKSCHGSGLKATAPSSQDAIVITIPDSKEEMLPVDKFIHYSHPPVEIVKWQQDYIDYISAKAIRIVFNSDTFSKQEVAVATATQSNLDHSNVYDTLFPLAVAFSRTWKFGVMVCAGLLDRAQNLVAVFYFGKDFKLKTLNDLMTDLKLATDSNADDALVSHINNDIAHIIYAERPEELLKYEVKNSLNPFAGKSENEILVLLATGNVLKRDKVLYSNFGNIFDEVELQQAEKGKNFYTLKKSEQRSLIYEKVNEIINLLKEENEGPTLDLGAGE